MMTESLDGASPSDMLLTGQSMMASTRGTPNCVNANITVLGSSSKLSTIHCSSYSSVVYDAFLCFV